MRVTGNTRLGTGRGLFVMLSVLLLYIVTGWTSSTGGEIADLVLKKTRVDEFIQTEQRISIFSSALQASRYWSDVKSATEVTLFVPTDDALRDEGSAFLLELVLKKPENIERLDDVMGNHIVAGLVQVDRQTSQSAFVKTVSGVCVATSALDNAVKIGPEAVLKQSVGADNGTIYIIDRLLWAPYDDSQSEQDC